MAEIRNEHSELKELAIRTGKIIGGLAVGAVSGYALTKGVEVIIPFDNKSVAHIYEGTVATTFALTGAFLANEIAE